MILTRMSVFAQAAADPTAFNWSSLGLSAVFLTGLVFVVRKYFELDKRTAQREQAYHDLVERLAVLLDRVQAGMAHQVNRVASEGPTPEEMRTALRRLETAADTLSSEFRRTDKRGDP